MHLLDPTRVHKVMWEMSRKYGDVMGFWFGSKYTVVISSPEAAKQMLKSEACSGRFNPESMNIVTRGVGIALQNDLVKWRKARTLMVSSMTGKQQGERQEAVILEEVYSTVKMFSDMSKAGKPVEFREHMQRESLNVVMRLAMNFRYSEKLTNEFKDIKMIMVETFKRISAGNPTDYMPLLKVLPSNFAKELGDITDLRDNYLRTWVKEHAATLDKSAPRDFLDKMLMEKETVGLTDDDIVIILWDIMAGGIDTTATSIEWLIYLLIEHPEVQKKAQAELQAVCGDGRLPTYEDCKDRLPYVNAVILETFRHKHFAPFGIPHNTLEEVEIGGYTVPKDTQLMLNIYSLHHDPRYWKDPEVFRPERFLEEEKELAKSLQNAEIKPSVNSYKFQLFGNGR
jgi:cytochrome P450